MSNSPRAGLPDCVSVPTYLRPDCACREAYSMVACFYLVCFILTRELESCLTLYFYYPPPPAPHQSQCFAILPPSPPPRMQGSAVPKKRAHHHDVVDHKPFAEVVQIWFGWGASRARPNRCYSVYGYACQKVLKSCMQNVCKVQKCVKMCVCVSPYGINMSGIRSSISPRPACAGAIISPAILPNCWESSPKP